MTVVQSFAFLANVAIIGALTIWLRKLGQKADKYDEFEFNNATDGGVVQHKSFKAARSHETRKALTHGAFHYLLILQLLALVTLAIAFGKLGVYAAVAYIAYVVAITVRYFIRTASR